MARLAGLEGITEPPILFFTLGDGTNLKSQEILLALKERCNGRELHCMVFRNQETLASHLLKNRIRRHQAVAIFDSPRERGCISHIAYCNKIHASIPHWGAVFFGIRVNPAMSPNRITSVVNQIVSDFLTPTFFKRIDAGQFPWGQPPSPNPRHRKMTNWKLRKLGKSVGPLRHTFAAI